jgi:hypothetical protein
MTTALCARARTTAAIRGAASRRRHYRRHHPTPATRATPAHIRTRTFPETPSASATTQAIGTAPRGSTHCGNPTTEKENKRVALRNRSLTRQPVRGRHSLCRRSEGAAPQVMVHRHQARVCCLRWRAASHALRPPPAKPPRKHSWRAPRHPRAAQQQHRAGRRREDFVCRVR